jgi:hypothetical protein
METKPGLHTTEFWVTVLTLLAFLIFAIADALPDKWAAIAGAVSAGLYAVGRGLAKSHVAFDDATYTTSFVPKRKTRR